MKKISTLALSIVICSTMFAAGEFFVKINSNGYYTVSLNGQTITSTSNTFRFFDLNSGNYNLKVYENGFNGRIVYDQPVFITNNHRTVAELDRFSSLRIIDKIPYTQSSWYVDHLQNNQNNNGCNGNNSTCCKNPKGPKPKCGTTWNHGNNNWNNGWNGNNNQGWNNGNGNSNYPNNYPYNGGNYGFGNLFSDNDMQSLLSTIKNIPFEDKQIEVIKTALKNRTMKTNQVQQLMQQFTFEQNKLEVAKYCYDKTIDQNNYYTLYDDFTFNNYSTQLAKYIASR